MNNINNPILLLRGHLVVRGEAEPTAEEIRADINAGSLDVGVGFASSVAFHGDERMRAVDRLHMHGLAY